MDVENAIPTPAPCLLLGASATLGLGAAPEWRLGLKFRATESPALQNLESRKVGLSRASSWETKTQGRDTGEIPQMVLRGAGGERQSDMKAALRKQGPLLTPQASV
jgi:hypothetical protein